MAITLSQLKLLGVGRIVKEAGALLLVSIKLIQTAGRANPQVAGVILENSVDKIRAEAFRVKSIQSPTLGAEPKPA